MCEKARGRGFGEPAWSNKTPPDVIVHLQTQTRLRQNPACLCSTLVRGSKRHSVHAKTRFLAKEAACMVKDTIRTIRQCKLRFSLKIEGSFQVTTEFFAKSSEQNKYRHRLSIFDRPLHSCSKNAPVLTTRFASGLCSTSCLMQASVHFAT